MQLANSPDETAQHDLSVVQRVLAFIEEHFASPISLSDVADAFGYSPCHLTTLFRQATGTPVTAWIIQRRISAAKELLGSGDLTVAKTCMAVGFTDLCYFTRQFTRIVGITPGRYRASRRYSRQAEQSLGVAGKPNALRDRRQPSTMTAAAKLHKVV